MAKIEVKLTKSFNNANKKQVATIKALGLKKIGQVVVHEASPSIQGMIGQVSHLVSVAEAPGGDQE